MQYLLRVLLWSVIATSGAVPGLWGQAIDVGMHIGVLDDGRAVLGGHLGVAVARDLRLTGGLLSVRDIGPDASLTEAEMSLRWAVTTTRSVRPYVISGLVLERSRAGNVTSSALGWVAGAGLGFGRGAVEPFLEGRALKERAVAGLFSVGLRVSTAPFARRGTASAAARAPATRLTTP